MTMTDTEAKALAIRASYGLTPYESGALHDYIEATEARHAAELREQAERFSEVAERVAKYLKKVGGKRPGGPLVMEMRLLADVLSFVAPAPDPLVEAMGACGWLNNESMAKNLRAAMQARGYEWRKIGEAGE